MVTCVPMSFLQVVVAVVAVAAVLSALGVLNLALPRLVLVPWGSHLTAVINAVLWGCMLALAVIYLALAPVSTTLGLHW